MDENIFDRLKLWAKELGVASISLSYAPIDNPNKPWHISAMHENGQLRLLSYGTRQEVEFALGVLIGD